MVLLEQSEFPVMTTIVPLERMEGEKALEVRKVGEVEVDGIGEGWEADWSGLERSRVRRSIEFEEGLGVKMYALVERIESSRRGFGMRIVVGM